MKSFQFDGATFSASCGRIQVVGSFLFRSWKFSHLFNQCLCFVCFQPFSKGSSNPFPSLFLRPLSTLLILVFSAVVFQRFQAPAFSPAGLTFTIHCAANSAVAYKKRFDFPGIDSLLLTGHGCYWESSHYASQCNQRDKIRRWFHWLLPDNLPDGFMHLIYISCGLRVQSCSVPSNAIFNQWLIKGLIAATFLLQNYKTFSLFASCTSICVYSFDRHALPCLLLLFFFFQLVF